MQAYQSENYNVEFKSLERKHIGRILLCTLKNLESIM